MEKMHKNFVFLFDLFTNICSKEKKILIAKITQAHTHTQKLLTKIKHKRAREREEREKKILKKNVGSYIEHHQQQWRCYGVMVRAMQNNILKEKRPPRLTHFFLTYIKVSVYIQIRSLQMLSMHALLMYSVACENIYIYTLAVFLIVNANNNINNKKNSTPPLLHTYICVSCRLNNNNILIIRHIEHNLFAINSLLNTFIQTKL